MVKFARLLILVASPFLFACGDDAPSGTADDDSGGSEASDESDGGDTEGDGSGDGDGDGEVEVTWHQDVAPIVIEHCAACHRTGGIAPFSLGTYASAAPWADVMSLAVDAGIMPPWGADDTAGCEPPHPLKHDPRLTQAEKVLLRDWADAGAPEGDPTDPAPLPSLPNLDLEDANAEVFMAEPMEIDGSEDQYLCFSLDPEIAEDVYLDGLQVLPGNDLVVHHVLVYADPEGTSAGMAGPCFGGLNGLDLVSAWAPGGLPMEPPENVGIHLPPGALMAIEIHYHPTGAGPETDPGTGLALRWTTQEPEYLARLRLVGNMQNPVENGTGLLPGPNDEDGVEFRIPAGVADHTETSIWTKPDDQPDQIIWSVTNHMHLVGTDMLFELERGDAEPQDSDECMLHTPRWDFNWQRIYEFDAPLSELPVLRSGDTMRLGCTYDNTEGNPALAAALEEQGLEEPVDVYLGGGTLDEMCLVGFGVAEKVN